MLCPLNITNQGVLFSVKANGELLPYDNWKLTNDIIYYYPLSSLVDNGFASIHEVGCFVPFENLYYLDKDELELLGIPKLYDKAMRIKANGILNQATFKYKVGYLSYAPDGDILPLQEKKGNIVTINGITYLLSRSQYTLVCAIDNFNNLPQEKKTFDNNLRHYATIKHLAIEANCTLDSYLANESVFAPDKIKITIDHDDDGYKIEPTVDITDKQKFTDAFEKLKVVSSVYPVQDEKGKRTRIVLSDEQKDSLANLKIKGNRRRTKEEVKEVVERASEYFNPDLFDLTELYSDRVIEIGIYKPKFYPFVSPYKSEWITGATIEMPESGTTEVLIKNTGDLEELESIIREVESQGEKLVQFHDTCIDINDARTLADIARRQLNQPQKPLKDLKQRKVLIIEENTEEVGFAVQNNSLERGNHYVLYENSALNDSFKLKAHQEEGIAWMQYLFNHKASGGLIADDMGLGKTLQVLYFIDWHSRKHPDHKPYIVVAPVSLLENWENEYQRFFSSPRLEIVRLTSQDVPRQLDKDCVARMQKMGIILTNYESLRNGQLNFCAVDYDVVVLDEAQKVKSPGTLATNAVKALKGGLKIAMTGTPVENSLLDLWCIMDFCVPGLMDNAKTFARRYQAPLKKAGTDIEELGREIHEKMGSYFIRRMKSDVAKDLPRKEIVTDKRQMPKEQESAYRQIVDSYVSGVQTDMLSTISQLRLVSEHPYLSEGTEKFDEQELIDASARLQATISFIDKIKAKDEKVIVFALFKESQRMLQRVFHYRYGILAKIINGDTPPTVQRANSTRMSRQGSINYFQSVEGFNIIIMSPIAAGMGLNVTAANHVIHYSRHWNPAKEQQATDRAYRIGQEKDVFVYYPMAICNGFRSFDETLDDLLARKTKLAASTIYPTASVEVKPEELGNMLFGKMGNN